MYQLQQNYKCKESATDYFPFGSTMPGRTYTAPSNSNYRYGFNGKEGDNEIKGLGNSFDFGARIYDSRLGRWLSVDPLNNKAPDWTPYRFSFDNPISIIDPDGLFEDWFRNDETGSVIWKPSTANSITLSNSQKYRNIGTTYSVYSLGTKYDYNQDHVTNITNASARFNLEGGQYIPKTITTDRGTKIKVTCNYFSATGGNANKALANKSVSLFITGLNEATNNGATINTVDISTTTTGKHSSDKSLHYVNNGARAFDIDAINNIPIGPRTNKNGDAFQNGMKKDPNLYENYGPDIQEKNGKSNPVSGHDNHLHGSTK